MTDFRFGVVGVVPFWSQADSLNTDSNFVFLRTVIPEMLRQTNETVFVVFFPNPEYGRGRWVYTADGFDDPQIRLVSWNYDTTMRGSVLGFDPARFAAIDNTFAPVTYWMQQVESAATFAGGYSQSFNKSSRPSMVAQHHYIVHKSLPYRVDGLFPRLWAQMGGSLASDVVVYNSNHTRKMARETFTDWLSIRKFAELDRKSKTLLFGLVESDQPVAPVATADDRPAFIYNHRLEAFKRPGDTFGLFDAMRKRHDFDVLLAQPPAQKSGGRNKYHFDQRVWFPKHDDYLAMLGSRPMINTTNSQYETFCISLVDSMAAGHLVIVPDRATFPELVPGDYPFVFKSGKQQRQMFDHVLGTWPDEYNKWREPLAEHARTAFGLEYYVSRYLDIMAAAESPYRNHKPKSGTLETMNRVWDSIKSPITPNVFRRRMQKFGRKSAGTQAFTPRRIVRDSLHFRDDVGVELTGAGVVLVRRT